MYAVMRTVARLAVVAVLGMRYKGRRHIPAAGGVLVCANHQSSLDPPLIGMAFDRQVNYLARKTLFENGAFRRLIESLNAIEIDREGGGLGGLKETLRRLKRGEPVLIFPEGTRTRDGEVAPLKPGFCAVARRAKAPLLPIGIDGAFQSWPRGAPFPRFAVIHICFGPPILPEEIAAKSDDELVAELERRIRQCHFEARRGRTR